MAAHVFKVYGKVRGKSRPRHTRNGHTYTAPTDRVAEREIREAYVNSGGKHYGDAPVWVTITTYRRLPKSTPKSMKELPDTVKPDVDNVAKLVMDALNGLAYDDDKQVIGLSVFKAPRKRCVEHMTIAIGREGEEV